jgi:hypothetical protein
MDGTKRASEKPFGHFVIVINRMMGDATDEELYNELLTIEPGEGADVQDRNSVRLNILIQLVVDISVGSAPL